LGQVLKPALRRGEARGVKRNSMIVLRSSAVDATARGTKGKSIASQRDKYLDLGVGKSPIQRHRPHASLCRELLIKGFKKSPRLFLNF
jgi:hypothetical protein